MKPLYILQSPVVAFSNNPGNRAVYLAGFLKHQRTGGIRDMESFTLSVSEETGELLRNGTPIDRIEVERPEFTAEVTLKEVLGTQMVHMTINGEGADLNVPVFNQYFAGQDAVTVLEQFYQVPKQARETRRIRVRQRRLEREQERDNKE